MGLFRKRPRYRITVRKRRETGLAGIFDIAVNGLRWQWSCTCTYEWHNASSHRHAMNTAECHAKFVHK